MKPIDGRRIATGSYAYWRFSLDYFLETAAMLERSCVELWAAAPHLDLNTVTAAELAILSRKLKERGLEVCCLTPEQVNYPINLAAEEKAIRENSIRYFKKAVDSAAELGCGRVLTTAGTGYFDHSREEAWKRSTDSLQQLAFYTQSRGVLLMLETLTPMSSNILNTPQQQREMIAQLPAGSVKPILDIGQMAHMEQPLEAYLQHGEQLAHIHLQDTHPAIHMALGDGNLPLKSYMERLEENGYTGVYAFEFNDARYRLNPREADVKSMKWLRDNGVISC